MSRYLLFQLWLERQFGRVKAKWKTLEHNGVAFPPEYIPHGVPVIYEGESIVLNPEAEEYATIYSKYIDTEYMNNRVFNKNFWAGWKKLVVNTPIKSLEKCNFKLIYDHLIKVKMEKKSLTQPVDDSKYKIAIVDGKEQPVGNYRIEPPGIFIGRGCNPKLGKLKKRIHPEDVIINIGKSSSVPQPPAGHKWKKVIHDQTVEWLASWKDDITGKMKYVWLGSSSELRGKSDQMKFDLAIKLGKRINKIRVANRRNMESNDIKIKQIATALYFIDQLALRIGNEKGEDEADTVGVTSLRIEHVKPIGDNTLILDFLGKDSIRYTREIQVEPIVYNNIQQFSQNKQSSDDLFNKIRPSDLNKYLQDFMKDLTAKVFRTYNASHLFQQELLKITKKYSKYSDTDKVNMLLDEFNKANVKVALLCNHQKNVSKSFSDMINKIDQQIKELKKKAKANPEKADKIKIQIKKLRAKKELKIQMKNISIGTSKINYIDPRITIAFLKKHNLHPDKIFSKTLQEKFKWAFDVDEDFLFSKI